MSDSFSKDLSECRFYRVRDERMMNLLYLLERMGVIEIGGEYPSFYGEWDVWGMCTFLTGGVER